MALIFAQHFIYDSGSYDIYYDTATGLGQVQWTAQGPGATQQADVPISEMTSDPSQPLEVPVCNSGNKYTFYAAGHTPFVTAVVELNSPYCAVTPGCDLAINAVNTTNETANLNDGTVTINATTSNTGLQYSLDNTTFQSSGYYAGLIPGNYIAYVKDANGCTAQQGFSIIAYSNPVQNFEDDLPTVNIAPVNISKWNAAFNPIVVNFQRKDFTIVSVTQANGTQLRVTLNTVLPYAQYNLAVTNGLYFKTAYYEFSGLADSYSSSGSNGVFLITANYSVDDTAGYLNIFAIKPGYFMECQIKYGVDPINPKYINPTYAANAKGQTRADLSPFLQTLLDFKDTYDYVAASYPDISQSASYQLSFREVWNGGNGAWFSAPYPLYVIRAAMQLGEANNGNVAKYVPFQNVTSASDKALFLTDYNSPIYWQGLPFEISFIYSEDVINKALYLELTPDCAGISGGGGSGVVDGLLLNADASYLLNADTSRFVISRSNNPSASVIAALGVNRLLIPDVFDCCASKIVANIYYLGTDGTTKIYIMQPLTIRTFCPCEDEPYVYLKWVNSRGAWDYYYFSFNQILNASVSNDQSVKRFVNDWTNSDTIEDVVSKSSIRSLKVGADNIDKDTSNALQWARKSIKAMMLVSTNPVKWRTVIIKDGSTDNIQTRKKNSSVEFELLLNSDNVQNQ